MTGQEVVKPQSEADLHTEKEAILEDKIRKRWGSHYRLDTYEYIVSHYLREVGFEGKRILDVGCGSGIMTAVHCLYGRPALSIAMDEYRGEGAPVTDLAFLKGMLRELGETLAHVAVGNALELPFAKGSLDVIHASQVLHHIYVSTNRLRDEPDAASTPVFRALREMHRCLSEDGVLVVVEAPRYTALRLAKPFGLLADIDFHTKQEPNDWIAALRRAGFKRFRLKYYTPYPLRSLAFLFSRPVLRYLLSAQYFILAYKQG